MDSSLPIVVALGVLALLGTGLGFLVNLAARRSVVNPWVVGVVVLGVAGAANGWFAVRAGLLETEDAFAQGERFGKYVAGPLGLPLLLLAWRGRPIVEETKVRTPRRAASSSRSACSSVSWC